MVDCDKVDAGCNGGLQENAAKYLQQYNAYLEADYPYKGREMTCQYTARGPSSVGVKSCKAVQKNSPDQMKAALANQPLAVSIDASGR